MANTKPSAVFLHTAWRSSGTWIWARFRENPAVRAFYEPLHEELATISRADIAQFRPGSWKSGHTGTAAYFAEYEPLLNRRGRGVAGYRRAFAFENFFLPPEAENPALEAYLRMLLASAHAEGRMPVLKFCRSLGRAAWLRQRFPEAAHVTVLRDPGAQWQSARQQYTQHGNRYFLTAPFMILRRNATHALVADALARLEVVLPPGFGQDLHANFDSCWRHVSRLNWDDRYRGFLALWVASTVAALQADTEIIESSLLTRDSAYRRHIATMIEAETGITVSLESDDDHPAATSSGLVQTEADLALANHQACGFVTYWRHTLPDAQAALLARKLADAPGLSALLDLPDLEHRRPAQPPHRAGFHYVDAVLYITLRRLTFPLRRLHGTLDRLWTARLRKTPAN
jgi:hypothetical protein